MRLKINAPKNKGRGNSPLTVGLANLIQTDYPAPKAGLHNKRASILRVGNL
jgi:hypothetical protein